jgi:hypothetical protein|tara:strand:- start:331 stop:540 length:210 start_codon:yes stop_codon:yes gene_type:complete
MRYLINIALWFFAACFLWTFLRITYKASLFLLDAYSTLGDTGHLFFQLFLSFIGFCAVVMSAYFMGYLR